MELEQLLAELAQQVKDRWITQEESDRLAAILRRKTENIT